MRVPLNELLFALSRALDFVEQELLGITTNHGKRAAYISLRIAKAMGLSDAEIFDMACCAVLHDNALTAYMLDAGPDGIRRLEHFKSHCAKGEENAKAFPFAGDASGIILNHHENWDGSGFHHLAGYDIPLRAAILRLADNMDLQLHMGDGRKTLPREIIDHAHAHSGTLYAPRPVEALADIVNAQFAHDLDNTHLDEALTKTLPPVVVNLTTTQLLQVCDIFALIIDAKSPFTKNHSRGLATTARRLATAYQLDDETRDKLVIAAYLHDVGKLSTPRAILEKPGPLTDDEFTIMREHAAISEEILSKISGLEEIAVWASRHHEKLNGKGYPGGRDAAALPFESRLIACCDIYQALTEERPYRNGMPHEQAMLILDDMCARGEIDRSIVDVLRVHPA